MQANLLAFMLVYGGFICFCSHRARPLVVFRASLRVISTAGALAPGAGGELIKRVEIYVAMHNMVLGMKRRGRIGEVDYERSHIIPR